MDPYIDYVPLYGCEETYGALQTGWFIYRDFMQNLKAKIVIWTFAVQQYQYPTRDYPDRKWGNNVVDIVEVDFFVPLLEIVERHS